MVTTDLHLCFTENLHTDWRASSAIHSSHVRIIDEKAKV